MEIWKSTPYEGYDASSMGRVRSWKSGKPKLLKPRFALDNRYYCIFLYIDGKQKPCKIHRLVAEAFIPNPEGKPQVNHINGVKTDNRVENLEWVTPSENQQHAVANGLKQLGENRPDAKFTNEQVRYVRENPDNLTGRELAAKFGVHENTISKIQLGQTYKSIGGIIRPSKVNRTPDDIREEIRRLYVRGSHEFGYDGLAEKFGVGAATIQRIVHED